MVAATGAGKDRAGFGLALVADGDHPAVPFPLAQQVEGAAGLLGGDIDADLGHGLDDQRVEDSRFQPGALDFEAVAGELV